MGYTYPRVQRSLTNAAASNATTENTYYVDNNKEAINTVLQPSHAWTNFTWTGRILSSNVLSLYRWSYQVSRIQLTNALADQAIGDIFIETITAYNLYEWDATTTTRFGDGTLKSLLPAGISITPIAGVVLVHNWIDETGQILYIFERNNGAQCAV